MGLDFLIYGIRETMEL